MYRDWSFFSLDWGGPPADPLSVPGSQGLPKLLRLGFPKGTPGHLAWDHWASQAGKSTGHWSHFFALSGYFFQPFRLIIFVSLLPQCCCEKVMVRAGISWVLKVKTCLVRSAITLLSMSKKLPGTDVALYCCRGLALSEGLPMQNRLKNIQQCLSAENNTGHWWVQGSSSCESGWGKVGYRWVEYVTLLYLHHFAAYSYVFFVWLCRPTMCGTHQ